MLDHYPRTTPWVAGSDDQFYLFDWSVRYGASMTLKCGSLTASTPQEINGFKPFDNDLHRLVTALKEAENHTL